MIIDRVFINVSVLSQGGGDREGGEEKEMLGRSESVHLLEER